MLTSTAPTSSIVVVVSDAKASTDRDATLITHSLGSCIGVCVYDTVASAAGLLHFQLPSSTLDPQRASERPTMFADTGMMYLLQLMHACGAKKQRLKVKLAGGAEILNDANIFNIGRRNHTAIRKILWQHGLLVAREDVGGNAPRTVYLSVANGEVVIQSNGTRTKL